MSRIERASGSSKECWQSAECFDTAKIEAVASAEDKKTANLASILVAGKKWAIPAFFPLPSPHLESQTDG